MGGKTKTTSIKLWGNKTYSTQWEESKLIIIKYKIKINIPFLRLCQSTQFQHQALLGNSQRNEVEKSAKAQKLQKQTILFI